MASTVATRLQLIHDGLPSAFHKCGVAGREVGAGKVQVQHRLALRLVAGVKQALGLGFIFCSQTGLLAGGGVLGVEYARAPEQVESRFHNVIYLNEKTVGSRRRF
ncbi:MAG: hypothetical protein WBN75_11370 [Verrucomicrobiia bacterium]